MEADRFAEQPFDPIAYNRGAKLLLDKHAKTKFIASLPKKQKRIPGHSSAALEQPIDLNPVFEGERSGKSIFFCQRSRPVFFCPWLAVD